MAFAIVTFSQERDAPGVVATNWLSEDNKTCWYPNVSTEYAKNKLVLSRVPPNYETWTCCPVKLLKEFPSYDSAKNHLTDAENTSHMDSDEEIITNQKRRRNAKVIHLPGEISSSSSEDELHKSKKSNHTKPSVPALPTPPPKISKLLTRSIAKPSCHAISPASRSSINKITPLEITKETINVTTHPSLSKQTPYSHQQSLPNKIPLQKSSSTDKEIRDEVIKLKNDQQMIWNVLGDLQITQLKIDEKLDHVISLLEAGQHILRNSVPSSIESKIHSKLPANAENFDWLEHQLKEAPFQRKFTKYLMTISGSDVKSFIPQVMRTIMTDQLAETYSLTGKSIKNGPEKSPFSKTESYTVIYHTCHRKFTNTEESKIRQGISDWLMQAKFRRTRREEREQKRTNTAPTDGESDENS